MENNPWRVESIQDFSCLKCPECAYFTKHESYFEVHAIETHPLSAILFDKTKPIRTYKETVNKKVLDGKDHVSVGDIKKEPNELHSFEEDPLNFFDPNAFQGGHFMSGLEQEENQETAKRNDYAKLKENIAELDDDYQADTLECDKAAIYSCTLCDYKTDFQRKLRYHLGFQFKCNDCGEKFHGKNGKQKIDIHWKTHHSKSVELPTPMKALSAKELSDEPFEAQHEFPCGLCGYKSQDEYDFKGHMESTHVTNDGKLHDCALCEFKNNSIVKFNSHLKNHKHYRCLNCENYFHGPNSRTLFSMHLKTAKECDTETLCVGQHEITCDICKFKCNSGDDFKTHFVEEHEVKGGESYDCSLCNNFKAPSVQRLIKHLKSHYKCTYCDKNFQGISSIRNLKRHMRQTHLNPAYRVYHFYMNQTKFVAAVFTKQSITCGLYRLTCSYYPVRYFGTLFREDITIFWD